MECTCVTEIVDPSEFIARISKCIQNVEEACVCCDDEDIKKARYDLLKLIFDMQNFEQSSDKDHKSKDDIERETFCLAYETEQDELKIKTIRREWSVQQRRMAELQENTFKTNRQLSLHSNYSALQGSCLTGILAKALTQENVLTEIIKEQDFLEFLQIAEGCLLSFISVYRTGLPENDVNDYQYALALCKASTNIAVNPKGRLFLLENTEGRKLLRRFIKLIPYIACPTGETIKITAIDVLNNMTIEEMGSAFLQTCSDIHNIFYDCLTKPQTVGTTRRTLELLANITHYVSPKSQDFFYELNKRIEKQKLIIHKENSDAATRNFAAKTISNLEKARKYFDTIQKTLGESPFQDIEPVTVTTSVSQSISSVPSTTISKARIKTKIAHAKKGSLPTQDKIMSPNEPFVCSCSTNFSSQSSSKSTTSIPSSQTISKVTISSKSSSKTSVKVKLTHKTVSTKSTSPNRSFKETSSSNIGTTVEEKSTNASINVKSRESDANENALSSSPCSCASLDNITHDTSKEVALVPIESAPLQSGGRSEVKVKSKGKITSTGSKKYLRQRIVTRSKIPQLKERIRNLKQ